MSLISIPRTLSHYNCNYGEAVCSVGIKDRTMTTVSNLIRGGKIQNHPIAGMFRSWLRGRKPSIILTFFWLCYDEGLLLAFQHDLGMKQRVPQTMTRPRIYIPEPQPASIARWWEEDVA